MAKISTLTATLCAGVLVAVAGMSDALAADKQSFEAAYKAADAARKKAASMGYEWRDTAKMLKASKAAAEKGDYDKAEKIAMKAKRQGELGVVQAMEQESAWKAAVLKVN
jgi:hypothetical protein